jgi:hypothetical protein
LLLVGNEDHRHCADDCLCDGTNHQRRKEIDIRRNVNHQNDGLSRKPREVDCFREDVNCQEKGVDAQRDEVSCDRRDVS